MNYWLIAAGLLAIASSIGHAVAGHAMYYRSLATRVTESILHAVFTAVWWIIMMTFALAGVALIYGVIYSGRVKYQANTALLAGAQFLACALVYLILSLRTRRPFSLLQWVPFLGISVLCNIGARATCEGRRNGGTQTLKVARLLWLGWSAPFEERRRDYSHYLSLSLI